MAFKLKFTSIVSLILSLLLSFECFAVKNKKSYEVIDNDIGITWVLDGFRNDIPHFRAVPEDNSQKMAYLYFFRSGKNESLTLGISFSDTSGADKFRTYAIDHFRNQSKSWVDLPPASEPVELAQIANAGRYHLEIQCTNRTLLKFVLSLVFKRTISRALHEFVGNGSTMNEEQEKLFKQVWINQFSFVAWAADVLYSFRNRGTQSHLENWHLEDSPFFIDLYPMQGGQENLNPPLKNPNLWETMMNGSGEYPTFSFAPETGQNQGQKPN